MNTEKCTKPEAIYKRSFKCKEKTILENKETGIYERNKNYNRGFCDG